MGAKVFNPTAMKKSVEQIDRAIKTTNLALTKKQTECCHQRKDGSPDLIPKEGKTYTCNTCRKQGIRLTTDALDESRLAESIEYVCNAADIIKIQVRQDNPNDMKLAKQLGKMQLRMIVTMKAALNAVKNHNNRKKKNNGDGNNDVRFNKPRQI